MSGKGRGAGVGGAPRRATRSSSATAADEGEELAVEEDVEARGVEL